MSKKLSPQEAKQKAVQDWLPFQNIQNGVMELKDGTLIAVLEVSPMNITLKSDREKERIIADIHQAINGQQEPFQIFCMGRPVDLEAYINQMEMLLDSVDGKRKMLLKKYIQYVSSVASGGEAMEMKYYIILKSQQEQDGTSIERLKRRAFEFAGNLGQSRLIVDSVNDEQILMMLFGFFHPLQAAYEKIPDFAGPFISTQLERIG